MPEEIEKEENIIKKVCREYSLTYKKLAEELGYSESSIRNLALKNNHDITINVRKSVELYVKNRELENKIEEFMMLKKLLISFFKA